LSATDTLGEALLHLVLLEWSDGVISANEISEHSSHWSGDLLQVWGGPNSATGIPADAIVWKTVWDSSRSAADFYAMLGEIVPHPIVAGTIDNTTPPAKLIGGRWWAGSQGAVSLYRNTNRVWLVWGTDAATVETLAVAARLAK